MSSAILYLAIVAIWACVLIPRWLRRDSAPGAAVAVADTMGPDVPAAPASASFPAPALAAPRLADDQDDLGAVADRHALDDLDAVDDLGGLDELAAGEMPPGDSGSAPCPLPAPLEAGEARRRMLTARRRLLGMLIALEAAAIALAVIGLAALWVAAPPTIMLAGYLLLLREAARADAEQAQREAGAAAAAAARGRALARARREGGRRSALPATPVEGTPLAARFAAAPVPADFEDSGRDFAPGLAGKYTPSNADTELTDADPYGYGELRFRRAVGD